jgi:putative spermidine/putrescine transport system ATP-binding protein
MSGRGRIELVGVFKRYPDGTVAVNGVNLTVEDGTYCCLLGPSGCGKTTILRMIAGHEAPTDGEIVIGGENVAGRPPSQRGTAMMFQSYALFPHLTVRDNIAFALRARGMAKAERYREADAVMEQVQLTALANRLPAQLSGGQQQRVAIARALAQEATVILADEPVASLDPESAASVLETLRAVAAAGVAVIASLHQVHLAMSYADRIVALRAGRIVEDAPVGRVDAQAIERIYERNGEAA